MSQVITIHTGRNQERTEEIKFPDVWKHSKPVTHAYMFELVEHYTYQQGDDLLMYEWEGPRWKPSNRYMTHEGYPLDTTCWYVTVRLPYSLIKKVCADTWMEAAWKAHEYIIEEINQFKEDDARYARTKQK